MMWCEQGLGEWKKGGIEWYEGYFSDQCNRDWHRLTERSWKYIWWGT